MVRRGEETEGAASQGCVYWQQPMVEKENVLYSKAMSACASSIHGQFGQRWAIPPEPKAPKRQRRGHAQFENIVNAQQNQMMEESLKGGGAAEDDKPKAGSKLQQALRNGVGARSISRRVEEQLEELAKTEPAALVDAVRERLESSKMTFKRALAAARKKAK